jgi:peptide/nickel transport system substrate-binding protein
MSRSIRWQVLLIGAGIALVGILLTYLARTYATTTVPTVGGTYVEGVAGTPHAINPLLSAYNDVDQGLCRLVFSGLTRFNSRGEVEPDLAKNWEISLDGLTYVFHLRPGVRWHDGTPFTADDVLLTVDLLQDPDYPGPPDIGALWRTVRVEKEDDYTVRFILSEPFAPFLQYTTVGILPAHLLEGVRAADLPGLDFNLTPVGTGPFQVEEVEAEEGEVTSILLQRYPHYHGSNPLLEHIRFRFYPSAQSAFRAYQDGEVEGVGQVTLENLPQTREEEDLNLYSAQMARHVLIFLNLGREDELPFFQEKEVRQALLYGLDREGMVERLLEGQGIVAHSPIIAGTWAYDQEVRQYAYDPDQARALLDEAGWELPPGGMARNKGGHPLVFTLLTSTDPLQTAIAEEVARQWNELDLQVTVVTASPLDVLDALERRDYQAALVELDLAGDPDPYPLWHQTQITMGQNYAGLDHRQISEIIETARITVDPTQRAVLYHQFQELFAEEVPAILLYHPIYTYGVSRKVQGVQIGPLMAPSDRFATAHRWYVATRRVIVSQAEAQRP